MGGRRLLVVTDEMEVGGSQRQIAHLLLGLDRTRWQPELLYFRNRSHLADEIAAAGIPVHHLPKQGRIDPGFVLRYVALLRRNRYDVVHAFSLTAELWTAVARILMLRAPKQVSSARGLYLEEPARFWRLKQLALARSDAVIANAHACAQAASDGARVALERFDIIANGVTIPPPMDVEARTAVLRELGAPGGRQVGLFVGRLVWEKNPECLVRALAALPAHTRPWIAFAGSGPMHARLDHLAKRLGLESDLRLLGERRDTTRLMQAADFLVLPSCQEGMSNAVLEAMAAGCPVIASAVGGNLELIEDRRTGLLFDDDDHQGLARCLARMGADPKLRARLSTHARQRTTGHHAIEKMVADTTAVYDRVVGEPRVHLKPRVLMVLEGPYPSARGGGAEAQVRTLCRALQSRGLEVAVVAPLAKHAPQEPNSLVDGVPVYRLRYPQVRLLGGPALWLALARFLITHRHAFDVWHVHVARQWSVVSTLLGPWLGKRVVIKTSGSWDLDQGALAAGEGWIRAFGRRCLLRADAWQAISQRVARTLAERGVPEGRIVAIPNAVDTRRFASPRERPSHATRFLFVGRLVWEKDLPTLLDAFSDIVPSYPDARLQIVGAGVLREVLEAQAQRIGIIDQVCFLGHRDDIQALMADATIGVLPSRVEGLSNALLECMAAGLPMVASRISGNEDFVQPGRNGWLFTPGDRAALAGHLAAAAALSAEQWQQFSACAQATVARKADLEAVVDRLVDLYRDERQPKVDVMLANRSA